HRREADRRRRLRPERAGREERLGHQQAEEPPRRDLRDRGRGTLDRRQVGRTRERGAAAAAVLCAACSARPSPEERALSALERLAFVPAGECLLEGYSGPLADCSLERAIVIDRFELTRADEAELRALHGLPPAPRVPWMQGEAGGAGERPDQPASLTQ